MSDYNNVRIFLQKASLEIGQKKVFFIKTIKNKVPQTRVTEDLNDEEIVKTLYEK